MHLAKAKSLVQHLRIQDEAEPFLSYKIECPNKGRVSPRTLDEISATIEEYGSLLELILDLRKIWNFWKKEKSSELMAEAEEMSNKMRRQLKLLNIDMTKMKPLEPKPAPKKPSKGQSSKTQTREGDKVKQSTPAKKSGKSVRPKSSNKEPPINKKPRV